MSNSGSFTTSKTIYELATVVKNDLLKRGYTNISLSTTIPDITNNQELICIRMSKYDYHFMKYDLSTNSWYHKPGSTAVLKYNSTPNNFEKWYGEYSAYGKDGKKGQPWSIITHLLYKNIFLEAYENPQTAEQFALELGIALPYMEDELEFLCKEELLRKSGNKYETNFKILSKEEQLKQYEINSKLSRQITSKLCEMIDLYVKEDNSKVNYKYIGYENAKWALLTRAFDVLLLETRKGQFENSLISYKDNRPKRPNDGAWTLTEYEYPVDFIVPNFVGLHGYNYEDEKEIKIDIHYGQYKFYTKGLYNKTPEQINYSDAYTLWLICNERIKECDKGYIEQLLSYGYLKNDNGVIKPNVLIFNKGKSLGNDNQKLTDLKNEIMNLFKQCSSIERGYIIDQALEDGWLKFDENTINTVGAFIYK